MEFIVKNQNNGWENTYDLVSTNYCRKNIDDLLNNSKHATRITGASAYTLKKELEERGKYCNITPLGNLIPKNFNKMRVYVGYCGNY